MEKVNLKVGNRTFTAYIDTNDEGNDMDKDISLVTNNGNRKEILDELEKKINQTKKLIDQLRNDEQIITVSAHDIDGIETKSFINQDLK